MYVNKFEGINEIRSKNPSMVHTTAETMDTDNDENGGPSNTQEQEGGENDQDDEYNIEALFEIPQSSSDEEHGEFDDDTTTTKPQRRKGAKPYEDLTTVLKVQYLLAILYLGCLWLRLPVLIADIHR